MKKLLGLVFVALMFSFQTNGQTNESEIKRLRQELNLSQTAVITAQRTADFPSQKKIKIFPAIKHNKNSAEDFVEWVENWNKENADRFGALEIVDDIENADVVAAQFRYGTRKHVRETRVKASIGKVSRDEDDDFFGRGIGNSKVRIEDGYEAIKFPLYSYVLVRGENDSWVLNFSEVDGSLDRQKTFPEARLLSVIGSKMKKR